MSPLVRILPVSATLIVQKTFPYCGAWPLVCSIRKPRLNAVSSKRRKGRQWTTTICSRFSLLPYLNSILCILFSCAYPDFLSQLFKTPVATTNGQTQSESIDEVLAKTVIEGDLSRLSPRERVLYYKAVCQSLGLNPLSKPFELIKLNGKLTLYARKDCTDQLRKLHKISIEPPQTQVVNDAFVVTVTAKTQDGRTDTEIGAVSIKGLTGDSLCNSMMKAVTKAKRRVTLSICGLGMLDETEVDSVPGAIPYPEPMTSESSAVYRSWKSVADAIAWATTIIPDQTPAQLQELFESVPSI